MLPPRLAVLLPCLFAALNAVGAEVYRWTDDQGRVVYGDRVPERHERKARPVDVTAPVTVPGARQRAPAPRRSSDAPAPRAAGPGVIGESQALPKLADADARCAAAWQRYNESYACFDQYRAGGKVQAEGYAHCEPVLMPSDC